MRLIDLQPQFLRHFVADASPNHGRTLPDGAIQWGGFPVDYFNKSDDGPAGADGIEFLCPKCFIENGGPAGTHRIHVHFAEGKTPATIGLNSEGQTVRWSVRGTGYNDLVISPSILLQGPGCGWHGFIGAADGSQPGEVVTC